MATKISIQRRRAGKRSGYALLAALLVLLMVTLLGILAMVSSTSEQRVVNNLSEDKMMFYYGEQGVYRILNHLHYLSQGLFGTTNGAGFTNTATRKVVDDNGALYLFGSGAAVSQNAAFRLVAYVNPKDFAGPYDRSPSRPSMVSVSVQNTQTGYTRAFRAKAQPKSIWDLAYYAKNAVPTARTTSSVESCSGPASSWYACQSVFHNEDAVTGDIYLRNYLYDLTNGYDNSTIFVRGTPSFQGRLAWAGLEPFEYGGAGTSENVTAGGIGGSEPLNTVYGMSSYANKIDMFPIEMLTQGTGTQSFRAQADIVLKRRTGKVWKIVFRNDMDVDQDGIYELDSRVASRYDNGAGVNDGERDSDDPGLFHLYSIPYTTEQQVRAAHWGDTMRRRHAAMTTATVGGEIWSPSVDGTWSAVSGPGKCYTVHHNTLTTFNMKPGYDPEDIEGDSYLFFTPVGGKSRSTYTIDGSGACAGTSSGIIFVDGDVLVSGIVDGFVTIAATGNIILDHEVQYEQHPGDRPAQTFLNPSDIDMLGLFATGNIVIPNSYPDTLPNPNAFTLPDKEPLRYVYSDDWSDAPTTVGTTLSGRGQFDHFDIDGDGNNGFPDDGNEEIHAVMVSFGRTTTAIDASGNATVIDPTDAIIRDFRTGLYAEPRTENGVWSSNQYFDHSGVGWNPVGNNSGTLTIWGAVIQEWPGRLSYDHPTSSCSDGNGANCRHMGHYMVLYHDNHLDATLPANPSLNTAGGAIPYGGASWDIAEWETIDPAEISDENVNGQPW